jgi:hypothetical protein
MAFQGDNVTVDQNAGKQRWHNFCLKTTFPRRRRISDSSLGFRGVIC